MRIKILACLMPLLVSCTAPEVTTFDSAYGEFVDDVGNIALPKNFQRDWTFLGSWAVDHSDSDLSGAAGFHNVYTQPGVVDYFRNNGNFPDGAILIKELLSATTATMTTGNISRAAEVEGWFVMVKDAESRFNDNPLWGDGWGWALFNADQPETTATTDYKVDCLGCHVPARDDDWVYLSAYPMLNK